MAQWATVLTSEPKPEDLPDSWHFILVLGGLTAGLNFS